MSHRGMRLEFTSCAHRPGYPYLAPGTDYAGHRAGRGGAFRLLDGCRFWKCPSTGGAAVVKLAADGGVEAKEHPPPAAAMAAARAMYPLSTEECLLGALADSDAGIPDPGGYFAPWGGLCWQVADGGLLHKNGGPADILPHGARIWMQNGREERAGDFPTKVELCGSEKYTRPAPGGPVGIPHRDGDLPAVISVVTPLDVASRFHGGGSQQVGGRTLIYYQHGLICRPHGGPSIIRADGSEEFVDERVAGRGGACRA